MTAGSSLSASCSKGLVSAEVATSDPAPVVSASGISSTLTLSDVDENDDSPSLSGGVPMTRLQPPELPLARMAREKLKLRKASDLLEAWRLAPTDLRFGEEIGGGGQADVFKGKFQGLDKDDASEYFETFRNFFVYGGGGECLVLLF